MKSLCLALLISLTVALTGCSSHSNSSAAERKYAKYLKKAKAERDKNREKMIKQQQRAPKMPTVRDNPPPLEQKSTDQAPPEPAPDRQ